MSVDLNVWSNHKLRLTSLQEGIDEFELKTSKKLKQWNFNSDNQLKTTNNINDVEFFTNFESLEHNFEHWNQIRIWTSFEFCNELTLLRQTLKIHPTGFRTRYSKWKELVTCSFEEDDERGLELMKESRKNWLSFREFSQALASRLGGNKIIYLDDHGYQPQEDKFHEGQALEEVVKLLGTIKEPCELELLELYPDDVSAKHTWHFDELRIKH